MKKILSTLITLMLISVSVFASYTINLAWNPPLNADPNITYNYVVYAGTNSGEYCLKFDVGTNLNYSFTKAKYPVYYFAASDYAIINGQTNTSDLCQEVSFYQSSQNLPLTYVGAKLNYGTNLNAMNHKSVFIDSFTNANFYSLNLIQTNKPLVGTVPNDENYYVYLVGKLNYGTNLSAMTSESVLLLTRTNPPTGEFYNANLVITNNVF